MGFFSLCTDEPEVFLPKYSKTAILHAAHFRGGGGRGKGVVNAVSADGFI